MYLQLLFILAASTSITAKHYGAPYTCYDCETTRCINSEAKACEGAYNCFASVRIVDIRGKNYLYFQKGCITHEFVRLVLCRPRNVTTEVYNCCEGNFCNDKYPSVPHYWDESTDVKPKQTGSKQKKTGRKQKQTGSKQFDAEEANSTLQDSQFDAEKANSTLQDSQFDAEEANSIFKDFRMIAFLTGLSIVICFSCCVFIIRKVLKKKINLFIRGYDNPALRDSFDDTTSASDSKSCMLTLHQRCIAQDVTLIDLIGKGRFGAVYHGLLHGESVAVKIFSTWNEVSWQTEVNIYTKIALYHENVLGFKGSVITTRSGVTEMWLLTAYHEQGSLYDYLSENTITKKEMMEFVRCICSGLLHLHTEMFASKGKPCIAHRDLKTRNILLTSYGTCVIADFGLAVVKTDDFRNTKEPINYKVGTKRYLAPEILDDSININIFESFKRADIYAFGLILWEICSRCIINGTAKDFHVAFHDCVPNDPDFEDMRKVVCMELKRPEIPSNWSSNETLNAMAALMKECWHENPEIRSTVCRVKKILDRINAAVQELQSIAKSVSL